MARDFSEMIFQAAAAPGQRQLEAARGLRESFQTGLEAVEKIRQRREAQKTLRELFGQEFAQLPPSVQRLGGVPVEQFPEIAKGISTLETAPLRQQEFELKKKRQETLEKTLSTAKSSDLINTWRTLSEQVSGEKGLLMQVMEPERYQQALQDLAIVSGKVMERQAPEFKKAAAKQPVPKRERFITKVEMKVKEKATGQPGKLTVGSMFDSDIYERIK